MPQPHTTTLLVERIDDIALLTLNRPESLNSISLALLEDFDLALDSILAERPRVRCLILTGAGRAFCSGGDISAHRDRPAGSEPYDLGAVLHRMFNPMLLRLLRLPIPFVNAINGPAAGAGCPLALAGDIVVAARPATFECGFLRIGLMPDLGATWLLPRLIGRARAHAMMMLDQRVTAETAAQWGMIHECVAEDALQERAIEIARMLTRGSMPALVATRKATLAALADSLGDSLERESELQRGLGYSADFAEGILAFFARRRPAFGDF